ncbi:low-density lipoprotein receptor-related protein 2-like [Amphiura filiformis]|uniref:low-density lipoprotein receptor-related protein 2-like n=1 Tax=Amphiura filiformis TaxID=82378 RepID=UPI003B225D7D
MALNGTKICLDIDECNPAVYCSQLCINRRQSYECGCVDGYTLDDNGQTCNADGDEALLLISNRNRLYTKPVSPDSEISTLISNNRGPSNIVSMDINAEENLVYWGDSSTNRIWKTNIDGSNTTVIIDSGLDYSELAYDWVAHNLYWSDPYMKIVEVVSLDTLHRATILSHDVANIKGISLDPRDGKRFIFWANPDNRQVPVIERLSMDGTDRRDIISTKMQRPYGLTLDLAMERVYFGDARMDFIEFCDYDGNGRQQVLVNTQFLRGLRNLAVWEDYVYWVDTENQELLRANKLTGENRSVVVQNLNRPYAVTVFHANRQPAASNPCAANPCHHLCLLSTNSVGYKCACGAGYKLDNDGVSCEASGPFLIYTTRVPWPSIFGRKLDPNDTSRNDMIQMTGSRDLYDIDFDMRDRYIYWTEARDHEHDSDRALNNIQRITLDGENRTAIVPSAFSGSPLTLAIDWLSRNIYWTNPASETIEVMQMDGDDFYRAVILSNEGNQTQGGSQLMGDPVALCVDPANGMLYWADNGDSGVEPHIAKAKMDGSNPSVIRRQEIDHVDYLIIDIPEQKLYWNDATYQRIQVMRVDGTGYAILLDHIQHGRGLAIFQNFLYYSESGRQRIVRVEKSDGSNPVVMWDFVAQDNYYYYAQFRSGMATGLRVYNRDGPTSNACSNNNGGCQHLCLPNGVNSKTCKCTTGFQLNDDGITCSMVDKELCELKRAMVQILY